MTTHLAFDIETGPQEGILESKFAPVQEEFQYISFKPEKVKRLKSDDDEDYREKYLAAEEEHQRLTAERREKHAADFQEKQAKFLQDACLLPHLGRVLAIGLYDGSKFKALEGDETEMLKTFWLQFTACTKRQQSMVGHNCMNFDLPFLVNRSKILGIRVPGAVIVKSGKWLNWCQIFEDTAAWWLLGRHHRDTKWSLDVCCHAFGLPGKQVEGVDGESWWKIYQSNRDLALEYLKNDCEQVFELYGRLCPPTV